MHAVVTAADIGASVPTIPLRQESSPAFKPFEQPVIACDKVRYVGEPLAVVLAESAAAAEDALDAIAPDIEPLPAVVDSAAAARNDVLLFDGRAAIRSRSPACAGTQIKPSHARLTSAASASRYSATVLCRWSRAACWQNGMPRAVN